MITIYTRTIIIYIILFIAMRILGKRQLGELEASELITTILVSEIASAPISDQNIPLSHALIPLITIMGLEVGLSFILAKFPKVKNIFSTPPSTLIYMGKINQEELLKNRISPEELLTELRLKNITDPSTVAYAILEQNGMLSIIPKSNFRQPMLADLNIIEEETGIVHIIISQGVWNKHNLEALNIPKKEFEKYLRKKHVDASEVYLLTVDDSGNRNLVIKEKNK